MEQSYFDFLKSGQPFSSNDDSSNSSKENASLTVIADVDASVSCDGVILDTIIKNRAKKIPIQAGTHLIVVESEQIDTIQYKKAVSFSVNDNVILSDIHLAPQLSDEERHAGEIERITSKYESSLNKLNTRIAELESCVSITKESINKEKESRKILMKEYDNLKKDYAEMSVLLNKEKEKHLDYNDKIEELQLLNNELNGIRSQLRSEKKKNKELEAMYSSLSSDIDNQVQIRFKNEISHLMEEYEQRIRGIEESKNQQIEEKENARKNGESTIVALRQLVDTLRSDNSRLENGLRELKETKQREFDKFKASVKTRIEEERNSTQVLISSMKALIEQKDAEIIQLKKGHISIRRLFGK